MMLAVILSKSQGISAKDARVACILQECKALNSRVIDFLKLPESVAKLLEYITQPAGLDADDKRQFKYPFSSAEVRARYSSGGAPSA